MPCRFDETLTTLTASEGESDDEEEETIMPEIVPPVVGGNLEYVNLQLYKFYMIAGLILQFFKLQHMV